MNKNFVNVYKDGITRTVSKAEAYDYARRGWTVEGAKVEDSAALAKELGAANKKVEKMTAELDKAKAELAKSAETIKTLTAEKAALTAELDKAKAELAKGSK